MRSVHSVLGLVLGLGVDLDAIDRILDVAVVGMLDSYYNDPYVVLMEP